LEKPAATCAGPSAQLLGLGALRFGITEEWLDYTALGLGEEHIPDLIAIATDPELNNVDAEVDVRAWAPVHAWRALGQLGATDSIRPLIRLVVDYPGDDWCIQDLPRVFASMGPNALAPLKKILANPSRTDGERETVAEAIGLLGQWHGDACKDCKTVLRDRLADFMQQGDDLNAFLVCALLDLGAVEHIDLIRRAYRAGVVNEIIPGDIEDVEVEFGLRAARSTVRRGWEQFQTGRLTDRPAGTPRQQHKVGRNQPCPCGSGRKYKRCCGAN
jgi:hypothetical protein